MSVFRRWLTDAVSGLIYAASAVRPNNSMQQSSELHILSVPNSSQEWAGVKGSAKKRQGSCV
jgi:hypothetical protein